MDSLAVLSKQIGLDQISNFNNLHFLKIANLEFWKCDEDLTITFVYFLKISDFKQKFYENLNLNSRSFKIND